MSDDLDKNARRVNKLVSKYIKSPLHKRTINKYDAILKKISIGLKLIKKSKSIINDVNGEDKTSKYYKGKIDTIFNRLEELMKLSMSSLSSLSKNEKKELYLEYKSLFNWCDTHIQKRTFTIVELQ